MKDLSPLETEINNAIAVLKNGGLILYPTDTIWGLGCDATNENAVTRLLELKNRTTEKGLITLLDNEGKLASFVREVPAVAYDLIEFSENPLTLILDGAYHLAPSVITNDGAAGFRITKDEFCKKLIWKLRKPIVSTSANISGQPHPQCFSDVSPAILKGVDYVVNLRRNEKSTATPSKVIRLKSNGEIKLLRS